MTIPIIPASARGIAVKNIGPMQEGMIGVVTDSVQIPFFLWKRLHYLCTFVGNLQIAVKPAEIEEFDHGCGLDDLRNPDFCPDIDSIFKRTVARNKL